jgi:hypothetical protein
VTGKTSGLPPVLLFDSLIFLELWKRACVPFQIFISASDGFARDLLRLLKQAAKIAGNWPPFPAVFSGWHKSRPEKQ